MPPPPAWSGGAGRGGGLGGSPHGVLQPPSPGGGGYGGGVPPQAALAPPSPSGGGTDALTEEIYKKIDADGNGTISELELIAAVRRHPDVAAFVLPGVDTKTLMQDESSFDNLDEVFEKMGGGKQRIKYAEFATYFRKLASERTSNDEHLRVVYGLIDADGNGSVSKLELVDAVERSPVVAQLIVPPQVGPPLSGEDRFDAVKMVFDAVARGKKRFDYDDFRAHFRQVVAGPAEAAIAVPSTAVDRPSKRVLIIGPGFGHALNPRQGGMIEEAGFQVHWCYEGLPNPEQPNFPVMPYLGLIKAAIDRFDPHVIACGSKGGCYMAGLWASGLWKGPTVLINAHPTCGVLPEGVPVVLCQGSNDEVYPTPRARVEEILATGSPNKCFLYWTANSGQLPNGQHSRLGDRHNMESLLAHDCLPRLIDAAMSPDGPEAHFIRTWRDRLTEARLDAERWLGYSPDLLRKHWVSPGRQGNDDRKLFEVPFGSEEFLQVQALFKAQPVETPAYFLSPPETWDRVQVLKIERIENGSLHERCTKPYYLSVERSIKDQGLAFEPGAHTVWAFHGADANAIDSIVNNPIAGFQPLASGSLRASLWGSGTYFARDPKYVADGGFCGAPGPDGTRRMLLCLLMTGIPCLGDPQHRGVLPFRRRPHRYHSSVDCLASPEVFIVQQSGAAHAAYLITFA